MANFGRYEGGYLGGVVDFTLYNVRNFVYENGQVSNPGAKTKIYFQSESAFLAENFRYNQTGASYQIELACVLPKLNEETGLILAELSGAEFVAVVKDSLGFLWQAGCEDWPLRLEIAEGSGANFADLSSTSLRFRGESVNKKKIALGVWQI